MGDLKLKDAFLHLGGSISLYRTLIQGFKDRYSFIDKEIKNQLLNRDIEQARLLAHSMKGLSGNLGASDLQRYSKNLEEVIKSYIGNDVLEDEIDAILGKEWIMFSEELASIRLNIDLVLEATDEQLSTVDTTSQLLHNVELEDYQKPQHIDVYTKELLMNESKSSVQMLIRMLNTYNFESINKALENQNEVLLRRCCGDRWDKIIDYIKEFEYDKAKEEILEGVLDEE